MSLLTLAAGGTLKKARVFPLHVEVSNMPHWVAESLLIILCLCAVGCATKQVAHTAEVTDCGREVATLEISNTHYDGLDVAARLLVRANVDVDVDRDLYLHEGVEVVDVLDCATGEHVDYVIVDSAAEDEGGATVSLRAGYLYGVDTTLPLLFFEDDELGPDCIRLGLEVVVACGRSTVTWVVLNRAETQSNGGASQEALSGPNPTE